MYDADIKIIKLLLNNQLIFSFIYCDCTTKSTSVVPPFSSHTFCTSRPREAAKSMIWSTAACKQTASTSLIKTTFTKRRLLLQATFISSKCFRYISIIVGARIIHKRKICTITCFLYKCFKYFVCVKCSQNAVYAIAILFKLHDGGDSRVGDEWRSEQRGSILTSIPYDIYIRACLIDKHWQRQQCQGTGAGGRSLSTVEFQQQSREEGLRGEVTGIYSGLLVRSPETSPSAFIQPSTSRGLL